MGQFSWLDCKTGEQILDDVERNVYVLVPREFGGGHIKETCYDGYGQFGGHDIYDLVADWNREYLSQHPEHVIPSNRKQVRDYKWYETYSNPGKTREDIAKICSWGEYRTLGIDIACYNKDNEALPYPIKITHDKDAVYEWCPPSPSDPNQGWEVYDDDDEWY